MGKNEVKGEGMVESRTQAAGAAGAERASGEHWRTRSAVEKCNVAAASRRTGETK